MGEKRRFKQHRGEFNGRFAERRNDERDGDDEEFNAEYALLRRKHREFEENFGRGERGASRDRSDRPERGARFSRPERGERRDRPERREGGYGNRNRGGFKGGRRDGFKKDGGRRGPRRDFGAHED